MTIDDLIKHCEILGVRLTASKMRQVIEKQLRDDKELFVQFQREQLAAGEDAMGRNLNPTYLGDPFFKTNERARRYSKFKQEKAEKPTITLGREIGLVHTKGDTPNLYITGKYYEGLFVEKTSFLEGRVDISIGNRDSKLGHVAEKYGREALGIQKKFIEFYHKYYTYITLMEYIEEGL